MEYDRLKIISGNGNLPLAKDVARYLDTSLVERVCDRFPNGEIKIDIRECVRGADVYLIQTTRPQQIHDDYFEAALLHDTLRRCGAERVTVIMPYCGYARQDRTQGREPLSMAFVARMLKKAALIERYVFIELHNAALEGLFDNATTTMNLSSKHLFAKELKTRPGIEAYVAVSPDAGGTKRVENFVKVLKMPMVYINKIRDAQGIPTATCVVGDVAGKNVILLDDMIDRASTMKEAVHALKGQGAKEVIACATHAVFSDEAVKNINESGIDEIIITDTIPVSDVKKASIKPKLTVLSWAEKLAKAVILPMHKEESTTNAFNEA